MANLFPINLTIKSSDFQNSVPITGKQLIIHEKFNIYHTFALFISCFSSILLPKRMVYDLQTGTSEN